MGKEVKGAAVADEVVVSESHYHSKKDRIFVRAIAGPYNLKDELARLRAMPRVRKGRLIRFNDGPQTYSRHYIEPKDGVTQMFHIHLEEYAPGGHSQKHCLSAAKFRSSMSVLISGPISWANIQFLRRFLNPVGVEFQSQPERNIAGISVYVEFDSARFLPRLSRARKWRKKLTQKPVLILISGTK